MIKQLLAKTVRHLLKLKPQASIYSAPLPQDEQAVELSYLGTAGFVLKTAERTVVLDPYLSRIGLTELLRPLHTNTDLLKKYIPHADEVLIGHAHYDHILDAPDLCKQTGARLIGSVAHGQYAVCPRFMVKRFLAVFRLQVIFYHLPFGRLSC